MKTFHLSSFLVFAVLVSACTQPPVSQKSDYDRIFPKRGNLLDSQYRKWFDEILAQPSISHLRENDQLFVRAMRGDNAALQRFFQSPDRGLNGEFGETWYWEVVALLVHLGDARFAEVLAEQDRATKAEVAIPVAIALRAIGRRDAFPATRQIIDSPGKP